MEDARNYFLVFSQGKRKEWYWQLRHHSQLYGPFFTKKEARAHAFKAFKKIGFTGKHDPEILGSLSETLLSCLMSATEDQGDWRGSADDLIWAAFNMELVHTRLNRDAHYLLTEAQDAFKAKTDALAAVAHGLPPIK
jgi:hypothetical protein